jgi:hypothetical protein
MVDPDETAGSTTFLGGAFANNGDNERGAEVK